MVEDVERLCEMGCCFGGCACHGEDEGVAMGNGDGVEGVVEGGGQTAAGAVWDLDGFARRVKKFVGVEGGDGAVALVGVGGLVDAGVEVEEDGVRAGGEAWLWLGL